MIPESMAARPEPLTSMFNALLTYPSFPTVWKHAKCVTIPKPGRTDISNPKNLHPISLLSCLGKVFEIILAK